MSASAASAGAAQGAWRAQALDGILHGGAPASPFAIWARNLLAAIPQPPCGLATQGLPDDWREVLGWSGMPLAPRGMLAWGRDVVEDTTLAAPVERAGCLCLPPAERLAGLSGLGLRPLRRFIATRCRVRLQTAPGVRMWIWPDRVVLVSLRDDTVGGFIYAPTPDQRCSILLEPGGWQMLSTAS